MSTKPLDYVPLKNFNTEPAFPHMASRDTTHYRRGLSKRDWFAGQVLPAVFASAIEENNKGGGGFGLTTLDDIARKSFSMADAMLKAGAE